MNTILLALTFLLGTGAVCPAGTVPTHSHEIGNQESREFLDCYIYPKVGARHICILAADNEAVVWAVNNPGLIFTAAILEYADGTSEVQTYSPFAHFVKDPTKYHSGDYGVYVAGTDKELEQVTWCRSPGYRTMLPFGAN